MEIGGEGWMGCVVAVCLVVVDGVVLCFLFVWVFYVCGVCVWELCVCVWGVCVCGVCVWCVCVCVCVCSYHQHETVNFSSFCHKLCVRVCVCVCVQ